MALPSLSTQQIRKIETLINTWQGRMTWKLLVERIDIDLKITTTRQTLDTYSSISSAYRYKKQNLRGEPNNELIKFIKSDIDNFERIKRLIAKNEGLQRKLETQLAFVNEIFIQSENNPSLTQLLNNVKRSAQRK